MDSSKVIITSAVQKADRLAGSDSLWLGVTAGRLR